MPATKNGGAAATPKKASNAGPFNNAFDALNAMLGASLSMSNISTLTQLGVPKKLARGKTQRQHAREGVLLGECRIREFALCG